MEPAPDNRARKRREKLKKLKEKIFAESENLYQALWQDYKKAPRRGRSGRSSAGHC
jgi:hypothetical protein